MKLPKGLMILLAISVVLAVLDFITTLTNPLHPYLESNPLYLLTGNFVLILLLHFVFWGGAYWFYTTRKKSFWRYYIISILVWVSMIRLIVIISNYREALKPVTVATIEAAKSITIAAKQAHFNNTVVLALLMPIVISVIIYFFFWLDHKIEVKD